MKPFKIEWFVYAQTAAYLLTMLICFAIVLRKSRFPKISIRPIIFYGCSKAIFSFCHPCFTNVGLYQNRYGDY